MKGKICYAFHIKYAQMMMPVYETMVFSLPRDIPSMTYDILVPGLRLTQPGGQQLHSYPCF